MESVAKRFLLAAGIVWLTVHAASAKAEKAEVLPFLHASGTEIVDERNQRVWLHGCNFGNWLLIEPWMLGINGGEIHDQSTVELALVTRFGKEESQRLLDLYRENWITQRDFDRLKSWNFNVVRLPFHCDLLLDESKPGELKLDAFRWLDRAVEMARKAGVYVILDLHGAPGGQSLDGATGQSGRNQFWTPENRRLGTMLWQKIAEHYANDPVVAAYDLLNEPYGTMNSENDDVQLTGAMEQIIQAVRQVDEKHLIFCSGAFRGIEVYGNPQTHGWQNVGFTEHFYPGLFGGNPTLETHAYFVGADMTARADLLKRWNVPYFVGEFNVVFEKVGGAAMMRRYFDVFEKNGWAGTFWSYKLLNREGGVHPDHWYMVTNRQVLNPPNFLADSAAQIETFCRSLGTMDEVQDENLHDALTAKVSPPLSLGNYSPVILPQKCEAITRWTDADVGDAFPHGGSTMANQQVEVYGGGRDIYEGSDEFHFVSRPVNGVFTLKADVTPPDATHIHAKSGLMFRSALTANSPLVMVSLKPNGQCIFAYRSQPGARIVENQLRFDAGICTLQLTRHGASFEAAVLDKEGSRLASRTIDLPNLTGGGAAGLFVLSHDPMLLTKATFGRVMLTPSHEIAATGEP